MAVNQSIPVSTPINQNAQTILNEIDKYIKSSNHIFKDLVKNINDYLKQLQQTNNVIVAYSVIPLPTFKIKVSFTCNNDKRVYTHSYIPTSSITINTSEDNNTPKQKSSNDEAYDRAMRGL